MGGGGGSVQEAENILGRRLRAEQRRVVDFILANPGRNALLLAPTGWGKTLTFTIPALCKRSVVLLISPLISLLEEQVKVFSEGNFFVINMRERQQDIPSIETTLLMISRGPSPVLLIGTPEKFYFNAHVANYVSQVLASSDDTLVVFDEIHTAVTWGLDFRKSYLRFTELLCNVKNLTYLFCTATLPPHLLKPIESMMGVSVDRIFDFTALRTTVSISAYHTAADPSTLTPTGITCIKHMPGSLARFLIRNFLRKELSGRVGIIFVNNRAGVERLSNELQRRGISCTHYHAHLSPDEKAARVLSWNRGLVPLIISTSALSLGINNESLSFVIHIGYSSAASFVEYVQEIGRCGRNPRMRGGDGILLTSGTHDYFGLACVVQEPSSPPCHHQLYAHRHELQTYASLRH
nr:PREDICTED: putative ATP-dependent DNA helicase Q1 [Bemisia tabaci]